MPRHHNDAICIPTIEGEEEPVTSNAVTYEPLFEGQRVLEVYRANGEGGL